MSFSIIIRKRLGDKNLSEVARNLGIPKTLLHDWVFGNRLPSLKNINHIKSLADYLSLSLNELLTGENSETQVGAFTFTHEGRNYRIKVEQV